MNEKRFVLCKKGDKEYIEDNDCVQLYGFDVLCEMLNELNEENDVLKQQLKTRYVVNKQYEELQRLREENKELKLQLEAFKDKLCELGVSDVKLYGKRYYTGLEEWLE